MADYMKSNQGLWNEWTPHHARSEFYDVDAFKNGRCTLTSIELEELGDISGKSMLHLQCHFGMDTLSWARLGVKVTGVDFSDKSIDIARSLSSELGIEANFVCSNIYNLPQNLDDEFDIVFTSYGVLCWLPDLRQWAEVIAHFLKPGGIFYIVEGHPFMTMFDISEDATELNIIRSYFHTPEPEGYKPSGSYAVSNISVSHWGYEWAHNMGDVVNALVGVGLEIQFLHEFPVCFFKALPFMAQDESGWWHIKGDNIPLIFSIKAMKTTG